MEELVPSPLVASTIDHLLRTATDTPPTPLALPPLYESSFLRKAEDPASDSATVSQLHVITRKSIAEIWVVPECRATVEYNRASVASSSSPARGYEAPAHRKMELCMLLICVWAA